MLRKKNYFRELKIKSVQEDFFCHVVTYKMEAVFYDRGM